jgi:hypothetical protein
MSEANLTPAPEDLTRPDHASSVNKDESEPIQSIRRKDRDDDLDDIENKHDEIPVPEEPLDKMELQENNNEEAKSRQEAMSPKTTFTDSHHGFHAKNGLAHLPTEANETNETMHTHDINSVFRDAFGSTQRQEMKTVGIGTSDDFEVSDVA